MGLFDRWRRTSRTDPTAPPARRRRRRRDQPTGSVTGEAALREVLRDNPNDRQAFDELAETVRGRAATAHENDATAEDAQQAADNAVWALAEELAQSPRAWRPLLVLGRLSLTDDREAALRRLGIAADRDASGEALAAALAILREAGMNDEALSLGVGHWRPREHDVEAGRHLVAAAIGAGRLAEARRHLKALADHPDRGRVAQLSAELEDAIAAADRAHR